MIKFTATDKWYKRAASEESGVFCMSAGDPNLFVDVVRPREEAECLNDFRRAEGFSTLLRMLRLDLNLTFEKLSKKTDIELEELVRLEKQAGYKASPRTLITLAHFYKIPNGKFLEMSGAVKAPRSKAAQEVTSFAAKSESFDKLTKEEKKLLQKIIKIIGKEDN